MSGDDVRSPAMLSSVEVDFVPPAEGEEWELPPWPWLVLPEHRRTATHGSDDVFPDEVVVLVAGQRVALAEPFAYALENQYCYDQEYYLVLRAKAILDGDAWRRLPWGALEAGDVFAAWDRFHGHEYLRAPGLLRDMSYGGDFSDLQRLVDRDHPRPEGARPAGSVSSATLLRAVREGEVDEVRALLAAGADPNAGLDAPIEALRSVSVDRSSLALLEAVLLDSAPMVEALLAAGARIDTGALGYMPVLHCAIVNRRLAVVPALLRFGASPDEPWKGKTARELAVIHGVEAVLAGEERR